MTFAASIGAGPFDRVTVIPGHRAHLAADRRVDRQDMVGREPDQRIHHPPEEPVQVHGDMTGVGAHQRRSVPAGDVEGDLRAGVGRPDHEDRPVLELRWAPVLARVELEDRGTQLPGELRDARFVEGATGDDHLIGIYRLPIRHHDGEGAFARRPDRDRGTTRSPRALSLVQRSTHLALMWSIERRPASCNRHHPRAAVRAITSEGRRSGPRR
jgi:hypothetical protein